MIYVLKYILSILYVFMYTLLTFIFYPFYKVKKRTGYFLIHTFFSGLVKINGIRVHVEGLEHIDPSENYLIVSNHQSVFDIPAIGDALPLDLRIFAKKELKNMPFLGPAMNLLNFVFVDRNNKRDAVLSLHKAEETLKNFSFLIFPEGTRSKDGNVNQFKAGGISIAQKSGCRILPVGIKNTRFIMRKGSLKVHSGDVFIKIFKPLSFPNDIDRKTMAGTLETMIKEFVEQ